MKYFFTPLFCLFAIALFAQKTTISGVLVDDENLPLPGATIMLLNSTDSTLIHFTSTDTEGKFRFKNIAPPPYILNTNYLGLVPVYQPIEATGESEIILEPILMQTSSNFLKEVQVQADHLPLQITKDTISYNPDAFQTQPNAVVEELLKKLPGIEVQQDGTIKAQGEDVKNIYVDGKEFFGDDPRMATKNLPAKALKKVKVYDKKSESSEFTGIDDGIREKTIDLQLKEEFKQGLFGTVEAGGGTDSRYRGKASVNRFSKETQVSFLGQINNVNEQGFTWSDYSNFSGGSFRGGSINISEGGAGGTGGVTNTGAAGLNFNYQKNKKFNVRSSYFYNGVKTLRDQNVFRQTLFPNPYQSASQTESTNKNTTHSINLNSEINPDSLQQIQASVRFSGGDGSYLSDGILQNLTGNSEVESRSTNFNSSESSQLSFNGYLQYLRRLNKLGRNATVSLSYGINNQDNNRFLDALNEYLITQDEEIIRQLRFIDNNRNTLDGTITFTEPLKKKRYLEASYQYSDSKNDYDQRVTDDETGESVPGLTNFYISRFSYHRPGVGFRYGGTVHNVSMGVSYQLADLIGNISNMDIDIRQQYNAFLPRASWRYDIGNGKNLRLNYNTNLSAPSITQLSPVIDNSDPLRLYQGNPNLDAEYSHNISLGFNSFSQFTSTNFFISSWMTLTNNRIINSRTIDEQFTEISTPINIDSEKRFNVYASYGRPLKLIHSRVNFDLNGGYTRSQNSINNSLLDINRWNRTAGIRITNMNSNVLEYYLSASLTFNNTYYPEDKSLDQQTLQQNYAASVTVTLFKKWRLAGSYSLGVFTSDQFEEPQTLPLLGFTASRYLLPGDKLQLQLSMFDALDLNRGISQSSNLNYIEDIRSNSIGRYLMLSAIYNIRGGGPGKGGGGPTIISRSFHP